MPVHGFVNRRERKTNSGKRVFYIARVTYGEYTATSRPEEETKSFPTKGAADAWMHERTVEHNKGTAVPLHKQKVADLLAYWFEHGTANTAPKTREEYARTLKKLQAQDNPLAGVVAQELKPSQVQKWLTDQKKAGMGDRTLQLCYMRLSQAYKYAMAHELVARNPLANLEVPKVARKSMEIWTFDEVKRFEAAAADCIYGPVFQAILRLSLRRGEVLGLRWRDVDLEAGTVTVNQTVGILGSKAAIKPAAKNDSSNRTIAIDAALVELLRAHRDVSRTVAALDGSDLAFRTANGGPIHPSNLLRKFYEIRDAAGLPHLSIHGLRHTSISHALILGAPLHAVAKRAGHARPSTTSDIYSHVLDSRHQGVADLIGNAYNAPSTEQNTETLGAM